MGKWQLPQFSGKDVVYIGKARDGLSFEKFIKQHGEVADFRFVDQTDGPDYLQKLRDLDMSKTVVVKTSGCPGRLVPVPYTTSTNVFFELVATTGAITVGITGTKGKSTTSSLVHHILQAAGKKSILCGNIGHPMLDYLDEAGPETIYAIELGAFQTVDLTAPGPSIALIVNLFQEHLDYFGSVEAYFEAKHQLLRNMGPDSTYVYDESYELLAAWAKDFAGAALPIDWAGLENVDMSRAHLMGEHNRRNIVSAQSVARLLGVSETVLREAPYNFEPLKHRLQPVGHIQNRYFVDDAISTTPESAMAAIETLENIGCMLLGGQDRQADYAALGELLAARKIPAIVLFPDAGERIRAALPAGYTPRILETRDMAEAVQFAAAQAPKNSVVVLSTAAPSFSIWKDYEEKGNAFAAAVKSLRAGQP